MEVICINGEFTLEEKGVIKNLPIKDKLYNIRDIIPTLDGRIGVLLNEVVNNKIPSGMFSFEPRFNINRFATLTGQKIEEYDTIAETV